MKDLSQQMASFRMTTGATHHFNGTLLLFQQQVAFFVAW
jgi:hypothetical protein